MPSPEAPKSSIVELNPEQGRILLRMARGSIAQRLKLQSEDVETNGTWLEQPQGVFVTLRIEHHLRGCIGFPEPIMPLGEAVAKAAVGAAFHDPRFPPVRKDEFPHLQIEVNVLTPPRPITDPKGIEVGRHGIIVEAHGRRGLLLPSVPVEYGWDRETFLAQTCFKAGLPPDTWKESGTIIYVFESTSFQEEAFDEKD